MQHQVGYEAVHQVMSSLSLIKEIVGRFSQQGRRKDKQCSQGGGGVGDWYLCNGRRCCQGIFLVFKKQLDRKISKFISNQKVKNSWRTMS